MSAHGVLHAYVATAQGDNWAGLGVIFVDGRGHVLRRCGRRTTVTTKDLAAFHGILYALWTARRLGSRHLVVHSDHDAAVAQINGVQEVSVNLVGPYLEARALLHAYRSARVEAGEIGWHRDALAMAEAALTFDLKAFDVTDVVIEDLPLWSWKVATEPTPA